MAGLADLLYLGAPNPQQQLAAALAGQQQQPGQQPPQAGPPGSPPSPGGPGPGQQPPAPPQPQAYQSPPDLQSANQQLANPPNIMSLYLQMDQRNRAEDQINRGLALITANHSMPSMRQSIMESLTGGAPDAGQQVGNLMSLYQTQQQMGAQQALLGQADAIDQKNGWPAGTARAEILAGRGPDLIKSMEPTDLQRNYNWAIAKAKADNPDATPQQIEIAAQGILLGAGAGGMGGADTHDRLRALNAYQANPANAGKPTPPYMLDDQKWKLYNTDLSDAKTQFNGINDSLQGFVGKMSDIANNPALDGMQGQPLGFDALKAKWPGTDQNQLVADMTGAGQTAKDMASRGGPKGLGQNLKTLGSSPEDFTNLSYADYRGRVIAPRMQQALTAQANAYGASGQLSIMPGYLKPYLDKMYQSGGEYDPGGGFKPFTPSTDKTLKQPNQATLDAFRSDMEHLGPKKALENLRTHGFDTSSLE